MQQDDELASHDLAIGNTRPVMLPWINVPFADFMVFFTVGVEFAIWRWQLDIFVVIAFCMSLWLYREDYNAGRVFVSWLQNTAWHMSEHTFGGAFVSPWPRVRKYPIFRGIWHV